jgi:hypothetical protein
LFASLVRIAYPARQQWQAAKNVSDKGVADITAAADGK